MQLRLCMNGLGMTHCAPYDLALRDEDGGGLEARARVLAAQRPRATDLSLVTAAATCLPVPKVVGPGFTPQP